MIKAVRGAFLLQDTPHRIALGTACGVFCSPLPMFGQMVLGMILARIFGGNVIASMPWTWISNPFTTPFIWYGGYRLGLLITPGEWPLLSFTKLDELVHQFAQLSLLDGIREGYNLLVGIFVPLLVGTVLIGLVWGVLSYLIAVRAVVVMQSRRAKRFAVWRRPPVGSPPPDSPN